jgi:hypothetical protein
LGTVSERSDSMWSMGKNYGVVDGCGIVSQKQPE